MVSQTTSFSLRLRPWYLKRLAIHSFQLVNGEFCTTQTPRPPEICDGFAGHRELLGRCSGMSKSKYVPPAVFCLWRGSSFWDHQYLGFSMSWRLFPGILSAFLKNEVEPETPEISGFALMSDKMSRGSSSAVSVLFGYDIFIFGKKRGSECHFRC